MNSAGDNKPTGFDSLVEALGVDRCAEADRLCGAGRYERSEARKDTRAGHYERSLQDRGRPGEPEGSEAAAADVRDGNHRALPAAGEFGRGGADRDVSRRRLGAAGRGHHRGALGHPGEPEHGVEPQQEDLRQDRGLAEPAASTRRAIHYL